MAEIQNAADAIRRNAQQYKQFIAAADLLDKYGSIENAISEANGALKTAQKDRDEGLKELDTVKANIKKAKADHANMVEGASTDAKKLVEDAKAAAFEMNVKAQSDATGLVAAAKQQAEAEKNALADDVLTLTNTKTTLKAECDALGDKVKEMNTEAEAAEKRLNKIRADIAKLAVA